MTFTKVNAKIVEHLFSYALKAIVHLRNKEINSSFQMSLWEEMKKLGSEDQRDHSMFPLLSILGILKNYFMSEVVTVVFDNRGTILLVVITNTYHYSNYHGWNRWQESCYKYQKFVLFSPFHCNSWRTLCNFIFLYYYVIKNKFWKGNLVFF